MAGEGVVPSPPTPKNNMLAFFKCVAIGAGAFVFLCLTLAALLRESKYLPPHKSQQKR